MNIRALRRLLLGLTSSLAFFLHGIASAEVYPYGQSASAYTLTFADEFNTLNSDVWNDHLWYETSNSTINYKVENGVLKIWPMHDANGKFFNRTFDTDGRFSQTYGFFEIEAKLPYGKGPWPAFWLFNHINTRLPRSMSWRLTRAAGRIQDGPVQVSIRLHTVLRSGRTRIRWRVRPRYKLPIYQPRFISMG